MNNAIIMNSSIDLVVVIVLEIRSYLYKHNLLSYVFVWFQHVIITSYIEVPRLYINIMIKESTN